MKSPKPVLKMPHTDAAAKPLAPLVEELLKGLGEDIRPRRSAADAASAWSRRCVS